MLVSLSACTDKPQEDDGVFKPHLDTETSCRITVAGSYDNFEALETEFDRFNEFYPNVELNYVKLDDYNNVLGTALAGNNKPNIFFSYTWMIGNENYASVICHMEDLSDPELGLNIDCIRSGLINREGENGLLLVPVFSRTYGMLVNDDLFAKEGINVPTTWDELLAACEAFSNKGYVNPMMGYSLKSSSSFMNTIAYPLFVATLAENPAAIPTANQLDPNAGEYMRPALEAIEKLLSQGCINLEECDQIGDNYTKVILRFFEGDVPMMICTADTVSGTQKRENQSEAFSSSPFSYSFAPIPLTDKGGYFIDSPSIEFSVNKDCDNLDMTNEFMRFLIQEEELNELASVKRLITSSTNLSFDSVYAPFAQVPAERIISPETLGIADPLIVQFRRASFYVGRGEMTVDEAVAKYGVLE